MLTKKLILSFVLLMLFTSLNISPTLAESVAVKGDLIFIADGGLMAKSLPDGQPNQCVADQLSALEGTPVSALLQTATDVVINNGFAVVTVQTETDTDGNPLDSPITDAVAIDVSNCLAPTEPVVDVQECVSTVDLEEGKLTIPCVEINGSVHTVHMERRGKSSNWEVSFFGDNPILTKIKFKDDDDNDDDDDDDS